MSVHRCRIRKRNATVPKMDLTGSQDQLRQLNEVLGCEIIPISAVSGLGIEQFHERVWQMIEVQKREAAVES